MKFPEQQALGVVHRHTPNLSDLRFEGPITLELGVIVLKAQRPVFIEGERTRPDPRPGPGASTTDSDTLCGEQAACRPL